MLEAEDLIFVGLCDLAGQVRGKSVPAADLQARLTKGVGYTPANICMTPFGTIASSPFGTVGDIVLMPDGSTRVKIEFGEGAQEHFCLADVMTQDGAHWPFCPRDFMRRALARLKEVGGCTLLASFEQEFVYTGVSAEPKRAYNLQSFREQGTFGALFMGTLRKAGMEPETFLAEFGARQFEVTVAPKPGIRAADEAVILRELARAIAGQMGHRAIFAPILSSDGIGNGTHIHMSLRDAAGQPTMHRVDGPLGLSKLGEQFCAGILEHMPALCAVTAPSVASYYRLRPNKWAPTVANVSAQDRAASLRICPGGPAAFNVEYRVADATACPYLALGALVWAGADGIARGLSLGEGGEPLPESLGKSLEVLRTREAAKEWFGAEFLELYLNYKTQESEALAGLEETEICERYAAVY